MLASWGPMIYNAQSLKPTRMTQPQPPVFSLLTLSDAVVQEFAPCSVHTFARIPQRVVAGTKPSDHFFALATAADLLKKTVTARKLAAARKSIVIASPFVEEVPAIPDEHLVQPSLPVAALAWLTPAIYMLRNVSAVIFSENYATSLYSRLSIEKLHVLFLRRGAA